MLKNTSGDGFDIIWVKLKTQLKSESKVNIRILKYSKILFYSIFVCIKSTKAPV